MLLLLFLPFNAVAGVVTEPPPIFRSENYPCSTCHEAMSPNIERRPLQYHQEIDISAHAEDLFWCLNCHDMEERDKLRLINGEKVGFEEVYRLCGQCHGSIYKDWTAGTHGKRMGYWNGRKRYLLCTHCHNPHRPRFMPITPEPPPLRPEETLWKKIRAEG